jgi:uncharacterized membrane protein YccC
MVDPQATAAQRSAVRSQARLARSSAEASLDRARAEPVNSQGLVELGSAVLAHSHRLVHALTALDATRQARKAYDEVPEFGRLVDQALRAIGTLAAAVRGGTERPARFAGLRSLQIELAQVLELPAGAGPLSPELAASVIEATDRLVNSLNSIAAVLADLDRPTAGTPASRAA